MAIEKILSNRILRANFPQGVKAVALDVDDCIKQGDTYRNVAVARGVTDKTNQIYEVYLKKRQKGNPMAYLDMKKATFDALTSRGRKPLSLNEWLEILRDIPFSEGVFELIEFCNEHGIPVGLNSSTIKPYIEQIEKQLKHMGLTINFSSANTDVDTNSRGEIIDLRQQEPFDEKKWESHMEISRRYGIDPNDMVMIDDGETGLAIAREAKVIAYTTKHAELNRLAIGRVDTFGEFQEVFAPFVLDRLLPKRDPHGS